MLETSRKIVLLSSVKYLGRLARLGAAALIAGGTVWSGAIAVPSAASSPTTLDCTDAAVQAAATAGGNYVFQCVSGAGISLSKTLDIAAGTTLSLDGTDQNITIDGGSSRAFEVDGGTLTLHGLTIRGQVSINALSHANDGTWGADGTAGAAGAAGTSSTTGNGGNGGNGGAGVAGGDGTAGSSASEPSGQGANAQGGAIYIGERSQVTLDNVTMWGQVTGQPGQAGGTGGNGGTGGAGGYGGNGGAGGTASGDCGGSGGNGGPGGNGGAGGAGGSADKGGYGEGGAIYNLGTLTVIRAHISGTATGGAGGAGGNGGPGGYGLVGGDGGGPGLAGVCEGSWGINGAGGAGGAAGSGGPGGDGGWALGGAIFNAGRLLMVESAITNSQAQGGAGGQGGLAYSGGSGGYYPSEPGGAGGAGGAGGNSGQGGFAAGGAIYNDTTGVFSGTGDFFQGNQALGSPGADGQNGGDGGAGGSGLNTGGSGGKGGNASANAGGGGANGGAISNNSNGALTLNGQLMPPDVASSLAVTANSTFSGNEAAGAAGGGNASSSSVVSGGNGGNGGASISGSGPAGAGGNGGNGSSGGSGGSAAGGAFFNNSIYANLVGVSTDISATDTITRGIGAAGEGEGAPGVGGGSYGTSGSGGKNGTADPKQAEYGGIQTGSPLTLTIGTTTLPTAQVGQSYGFALSASGGTGPYTWSLIDGSLPAGLTFSAGGSLSGTPTAASAAITLTFLVQDATSSAPQAAFVALPLAVTGTGSATPTPTPAATPTAIATATAVATIAPTPGATQVVTIPNSIGDIVVPGDDAGSILLQTTIRVIAPPSSIPSGLVPLAAVEIDFNNESNGAAIHQFTEPVTIEISYAGLGLTPDQLNHLVIYNATEGLWLATTLDTSRQVAIAKSTQFSVFTLARVIGPVPMLYLPAVLKDAR